MGDANIQFQNGILRHHVNHLQRHAEMSLPSMQPDERKRLVRQDVTGWIEGISAG